MTNETPIYRHMSFWIGLAVIMVTLAMFVSLGFNSNNLRDVSEYGYASSFLISEEEMRQVVNEDDDVLMIDVRNALARLTELEASQYPFYAIYNENYDGYITMLLIESSSSNQKGMAGFLVETGALNQTSEEDLRNSIYAINDLAWRFGGGDIEYIKSGELVDFMLEMEKSLD